jgi:hypothetical protein
MEVVPREHRVGAQLLGPEPRVAHIRGRPMLGLHLHPDPDRASLRHEPEG